MNLIKHDFCVSPSKSGPCAFYPLRPRSRVKSCTPGCDSATTLQLMYSRGVQVVFVLDTESDAVSKYKPLCYACIRILFSLSDFPSKKPLKWKYMLLKENRPVVGKAPPFMELRLDCMETLFEALKCELGKYGSLNSDKPFPSSLLSCVLADVLQGSLCDSLEIYSPPKRHMWLGVEHEDPLKIVFVYNKCLTSFEGVFSSEIWKCVLDRNIFLCCLYDHGEKVIYNMYTRDCSTHTLSKHDCFLHCSQTFPNFSAVLMGGALASSDQMLPLPQVNC